MFNRPLGLFVNLTRKGKKMDQKIFVDKIREALSRYGTKEEAEVLGRAPKIRQPLDLSLEQKVERFTLEMGLLNVEIIRVGNWEETRKSLVQKLLDRGIKRIALAGAELDAGDSLWSQFERAVKLMEVEQAEAGLVQADYGIAETGSSVVMASPAKPRIFSLLPPVLYIALPVSKILGSMPELMAVLGGMNQDGTLPATVNVITGPSRTADIELSLTVGVHGPGEVTVILVG